MGHADDLWRDVGQLLWVGFQGTSLPAEFSAAARAGQLGAAILFARNIARASDGDGDGGADLRAVAALNAAIHAAAPDDGPPLWIAVDQEGGRVQRVRAPATVWPPMLGLDRVAADAGGDDDGAAVRLADHIGEALGRELAALGFDIDFAPVLDVHTNPDNPVIGDRALSTDPHRVAARALAFAAGLARANVLGCGKHFPGHGDTHMDSHLALPRLDHDRARLDAVELVPFGRAARAHIPMIMTAHVVFAAIDATVPATLSRAVVTDLLRGELGYAGLIVSDDLGMGAIVGSWGIEDAAVAAIDAGCDALLLCNVPEHPQQAFAALVRAAEADAGFRARVGDAAARVRAAKAAHAARAAQIATPALTEVGCAAHQALARKLIS